MNKGSKINIALIGSGSFISGVYIEALQLIASKDSKVSLICGVDTDPSVAEQCNLFPIYKTIDEMIANHPEINTVCILTPPETHYELMEKACEYRLNAIVEKPPALSSRQCQKIIKLFKQKNCLVYFAWHAEFAAGVDKLKQLLSTQSIKSFQITQNENVKAFRKNDEVDLFPGALFDSGINIFAVLANLPNMPKLKIDSASYINHPSFKQIDTNWIVDFNFGSFRQDWLSNEFKRTIHIETRDNNYLLDIHNGELKENNKLIAKETEAHTMLGEYYRQCQDAIKCFRNNKSKTDYKAIQLAENIKSVATMHGGAVC